MFDGSGEGRKKGTEERNNGSPAGEEEKVLYLIYEPKEIEWEIVTFCRSHCVSQSVCGSMCLYLCACLSECVFICVCVSLSVLNQNFRLY